MADQKPRRRWALVLLLVVAALAFLDTALALIRREPLQFKLAGAIVLLALATYEWTRVRKSVSSTRGEEAP